jgi:hypothetical protein
MGYGSTGFNLQRPTAAAAGGVGDFPGKKKAAL